MNIAKIIYQAYSHKDFLSIDLIRDCADLDTLLKKVITNDFEDTLFKFIVMEVHDTIDNDSDEIAGPIRALERTVEDIEAIIQALETKATEE